MRAAERLTADVIRELSQTITDAGGNEVFAVGSVDQDGLVRSINVAARGDQTSVPALRPYLERGDVLIHNHPSGNLTPSTPDMTIASRVGGEGIGFFIVNNDVSEVYVVAEPVVLREIQALDVDGLGELLEPEGPLSRIYPEYEERPSQIAMLRHVAGAFNQGTLCAAEAGTGVGKSLAYLIPAFQWAEQNQERIVISTSTINLQQQLVEKDIPLVQRLLGTDIRAVLVKGRRNYVCPRRLEEALDEEMLDPDEAGQLRGIKDWAATSNSGSRSDLGFQPSEVLWSRVCSEADLCHGLRCSLREGCFIHKARREAAAAQILVANHHLLFSDLAVRRTGIGYDTSAVLPPFQRIIFDEAHSIESSATSFFSDSLHRLILARTLGRLHRRRRGRTLGLALSLERLLPETSRAEAGKLPNLVQEVSDRSLILDRLAGELLEDERSLLLDDLAGDLDRCLWEPLRELQTALLAISSLVTRLIDRVEEPDPEDFTIPECRVVARRLDAMAEVCHRFGQARDGRREEIYWLESVRGYSGDRFVRFVITPLEIAPVMNEAVYDPYPSVVFTSATLTVGGRFEYWRSRVGLHEEVLEGIFPSPFDYANRVLLGIPDDIPAPTEPMYTEALIRIVGDTLELSEGRALVLFTSYAALTEVYDSVAPRLIQLGISPMRQGDDDRGRLLQRFQQDIGSVLFATDSFWQGVDAPGKALEVLILTRLPFRVPSEPILKARTRALEQAGGNPFSQLALPDAVVRLRQGFGRLMRRRSDGGIVLILDVRVLKKAYGEAFLLSLPPTTRKIGSTSSVLQAVEDWVVRLREREETTGQ